MQKRILVNGAGGFIGGHLVKKLKAEGNWVRAVDLKQHEYGTLPADEFILGDLRDAAVVRRVYHRRWETHSGRWRGCHVRAPAV
jgi:nucleoside-diphosphate-sugar epimerase